MKKFFALALLCLISAGCANTPPTPPEPVGPLVKVNMHQPNETFQGDDE